ncbi:hypothetical protein SLA2020_488370 [Shorea laevis]
MSQAAETLREIVARDRQMPPQIEEEVAPPAPAPVVPELAVPLIPDEYRMRELHSRLCCNSLIGRYHQVREMLDLLEQQADLEKKIDAALVHDGVDPQSILNNRRGLRGIILYNNNGIAFSRRTLTAHLNQVQQLGTRESLPYRRILQAIRRHDLSL